MKESDFDTVAADPGVGAKSPNSGAELYKLLVI